MRHVKLGQVKVVANFSLSIALLKQYNVYFVSHSADQTSVNDEKSHKFILGRARCED